MGSFIACGQVSDGNVVLGSVVQALAVVLSDAPSGRTIALMESSLFKFQVPLQQV